MSWMAFAEMFWIGVVTPLTAVCVLPLYPAFISYLASTGDDSGRGRSPAVLGTLVVAGVISFMAVAGYVFVVVLGVGIESGFVGRFGPWAFGVLAVVGAVLVVDPGGFSRLPSVEPPHTERPYVSAFGYGFFFGGIVVPCNPGFIGLFFARQAVLFEGPLRNLLGFVLFGLGIGTPLLAFALLSESFGRRLTTTLARYSGPINRAAGGVLLLVALYYLVFVFAVLPGAPPTPPSLPVVG
ncbi:cytochrome c biogenesis protein CcdA [Natronomonas sp. LN261]|jgi:cytochrome c-type biogenesis protein|uniref:cytochrome c biogenesis protein CcdA n=1 Tax=Natronomonas sp. LN261 TaxID=2750669 RepID=UPI0015EED395|nr:cytochrome c biogenesis protein CcdA [Natronomonas sp. LN261]